MADFRKKLFGLAGAVTMFTGMAFGQYCNTTGGNTVSLTPVNGAAFIRQEGQTELLPALNFNCSSAAPVSATGTLVNLTVYLSPAISITSKLLPGSTSNTAASAIVGGTLNAVTGVVTGGTSYPGVVIGSSVTFSNINLATGTGNLAAPIFIGNIRVNASALPGNSAGTLPSPITAQAFVSSGTTSGSTVTVTPGASNATNVAYSFSGLGPNDGKPYTSYTAPTTTVNGSLSGTSFSTFGVCGSINNSSSAGSAATNFFVYVNEGFQNAFKTVAEEADNATGGLAVNSGTRVTMTFNGIPTNLGIYLPQVVFSTAAGAPGTGSSLTLQLNPLAASGPANATTIATSPSSVNGLGLVQIPVSGTTATATYEVTADNPTAIDSFAVPVYLQAATNTLSAGSTLTVTTGLAPQPATAASLVPSFSSTAPSIATFNTIPFGACSTNLLFPFVTNANGFETGIAIANTSKDPFSTKIQSGICTLNFYQSGVSGATNPAAVTAPNLSEGANQPYLAGEDYAFTLTQALAVNAANPATFQGYVIAQCAFSYAHAFAYILGGLQPGMFVNPNNTAMGYLAIVLPGSRSTSNTPLADSAGN